MERDRKLKKREAGDGAEHVGGIPLQHGSARLDFDVLFDHRLAVF